jgi:toxin ParE1/3/4
VKRKADLRPEAAAEYIAQRHWYESKRAGLGDDFERCVESALKKALRSPDLYPVVFRDVRRVLVRRFPFGIFYVPTDEGITVIAIFNCARAPAVWKSRRRNA